MTLNLAAIFGAEPSSVMTPIVGDPPLAEQGDPAEQLRADLAATFTPWPIVPGTHHWNPYIDPTDLDAGHWGQEFIPGYHVDIRQPSNLRPLLTMKHDSRPEKRKTNAQDCA